ncbi:hypothetical protein VTP01DRAFT_7801, partial [Rhizomucor pusillus]|uniref:uncharacterized protein n=1 Tax=Rhizomucor pusillus TaxID=4840 RepID=UPI0037435985
MVIVICPLILKLKDKGEDNLKLPTLLDEPEEEIVDAYDGEIEMRSFKGSWIKKITTAASLLNIHLSTGTPSWRNIEQKIALKSDTTPSETEAVSTSEANSTSNNHTTRSQVSKSSSSPLKVKLTATDKQAIKANFEKLDSLQFWTLEATVAQAAREGIEAISVEQKVIEFALSCNYYHPSQSLILDLDDGNWESMFIEDELEELRTAGRPMLRPLPQEMQKVLDDLKGLRQPVDVFNYARQIPLDPINEPLKVWLSTELQNTARRFLVNGTFNIADMSETDQLYKPFCFFNSIFEGTGIKAYGTEKSSRANAAALNSKRRLSAVDEIENRKMGRKVDTVYVSGSTELGCTEIGAVVDQTKAFKDSSIKMPSVLRDMLLMVTYTPELLRECHVLGYSMNGGHVSLLDVDVPYGYITRIRRTDPLEFPDNNENFISKLLPLLELALIGKNIMESTLALVNKTRRPITVSTGKTHWCLPSNFKPSTSPSSSSASTSRSASSKCQRKN